MLAELEESSNTLEEECSRKSFDICKWFCQYKPYELKQCMLAGLRSVMELGNVPNDAHG